MTGTSAPGSAAPSAPGARVPPPRNVGPPQRNIRRRTDLRRSTPRTLGLAMVGLTVAAIVWGALGVWTASRHASAAHDVVATREPASQQARQMYESLADADVTATSAFLAGPKATLAARLRYQKDLAQAGASLSELKADSVAGDAKLAASESTIAQGLPVYAGYIASAQSEEASGYQLTGGSFIQVASEQMHLTLLPAAGEAFADVNASLAARSAQASGLPWILVALALSAVVVFALVRIQGWLSRRTRRRINYGLVGATGVLVVVAVWLLIASLVARGDLGHARAAGSAPVESLAQASITAGRARGDEILNLISRTGATSFRSDVQAARKEIDARLAEAAGASTAGAKGRFSVLRADASSWFAAQDKVFNLDVAANYAAETRLVIGSGAGSSAARYAKLQTDINRAIGTDQSVFRSSAQAGANAYRGLTVGFVVAAVLMAAGCIWGLSRRLAEYR